MNSLLPNSVSNPSTSQTAAVVTPGSSADPTVVTPVTPASAQVAPAVALDKVAAEPGVLQKALGMAQPYLAKVDAVTHPYVEKVQQTTKPYTDAALTKAKELIDKVEGPGPAYPGTPVHAAMYGGDGATMVPATAGELRSQPPTSVPGAPSTGTTSVNSSTTAVGAGQEKSLEERIDGVFATISNRASAVASKIDEKTATPNKPGWATQVASAVQKVTDRADAYIQGHSPGATNVTGMVGHPVTTTTNSVPHTDKPDMTTVPAAPFAAGPTGTSPSSGVPTGTSTSAGAPVGAGPTPIVPVATNI